MEGSGVKSLYVVGVPPNIQRYLPMLVIFAAILFILPQFTKKSSHGPSKGDRATATLEAINLVGNGEKAYLAAHGRYSSHLADLIATSPHLATDLASGVAVSLDVASDGKTFLAQATSDQLALVRSRTATHLLADSCTPLKSNCPTIPKK